MTGLDFLDTNVLVYAYAPGNAHRQRIAQEILEKALSGEAIVSYQVLAEFAAVLLHRVSPPMRPQEVVIALDALGLLRLVDLDHGVVRRAVEAPRILRYSFLRRHDCGRCRARRVPKNPVRRSE